MINFQSILLSFVVAYIFLKPFYFWSSGLPQASDIMIIPLIICSPFLFLNRVGRGRDTRLFLWFAFVIYSLFLNLCYSILEQDVRLVIPSIYLIYNFLFLLSICYLAAHKLLTTTRVVILGFVVSLSLIFQASLLPSDSARMRLMFNNPNQLASYVMLISAFVSYFVIKGYGSLIVKMKLMYTFSMTVNFYIILATLSVGAILIIPTVISLLIFVFYKKYIPALLLIFSVLFFSFGLLLFQNDGISEDIFNRIDNKENNNIGIIEERGYDRILNHPEYIFLGAGEGALHRFKSFLIDDYFQLELHSTLGTLLFSYGFFGLFSFLYICFKQRKDYVFLIILLALMPYLLTHNSLRHPFLLIILFLPFIHELYLADSDDFN